MRVLKLWMGLGALMCAALVAGAVTAFACTSLATLNSSAAQGAPGSNLTITGSSFATSDSGASAVAIHWNGATGPLLATVTPDASGAISANVTVPTNVEPGYYILTATQTEKNGAPAFGTPAKTSFLVLSPNGAVSGQQGGTQPGAPGLSGSGVGAGTIGLLAGLGVLGLALFGLGAAAFVGSYRSAPSVSRVRKS